MKTIVPGTLILYSNPSWNTHTRCALVLCTVPCENIGEDWVVCLAIDAAGKLYVEMEYVFVSSVFSLLAAGAWLIFPPGEVE